MHIFYSVLMPNSCNLRIGRFSLNNGMYLATFATKKRESLFKEFDIARIVVRRINSSLFADTLAFVVMPDHVHWLIQLKTCRTLSQTVQAAKISCTRSINRRLSRKGTIWQPGFHDHALRNEEALKEIARYVVANPVRAKLVKKVGDYPHWDAIWINNSCTVVEPKKAIEILDKANQGRINKTKSRAREW